MLRSSDPIRVKVRGGFSLLDMKRFVESRNFKGNGFKGLSFEQLLALKSPIVPIDFHGNAHTDRAEEVQVTEGKLPKLIVQAGMAPSGTRANELIKAGAVEIDGAPMRDPAHVATPGLHKVRVGKQIKVVRV